jgi:cytochrome b6-f complex iron-sulfur subunit
MGTEFRSRVGRWEVLAGIAVMLVMIAAVVSLVLLRGAKRPEGELIVGPPSEFGEETVSGEFVEVGGFWLVRSASYDGLDSIVALRAFSPISDHEIHWSDTSQVFECPEDGSRFNMAGMVLEGPALRPLERYRITLGEEGLIRVEPSRVFREELGQWTALESAVAP